MTDSIAVLEDSYSEVVVNVMALMLKATNSTGDHLYFCNCEGESWQCQKRFEGAYSRD